MDDITVEQSFTNSLREICETYSQRTAAEEALALTNLNSRLKDDGEVNWKAMFERTRLQIDNGAPITNVVGWRYCLIQLFKTAREIRSAAEEYGFQVLGTENTRRVPASKSIKSTYKRALEHDVTTKSATKPPDKIRKSPAIMCTGCGRPNTHEVQDCLFKQNRFFNNTNLPHPVHIMAGGFLILSGGGVADFVVVSNSKALL